MQNRNRLKSVFVSTLSVVFFLSSLVTASPYFSRDTVYDQLHAGDSSSVVLYNPTNDSLIIDSIGVRHTAESGTLDFVFSVGKGRIPSYGFRYNDGLPAQEIYLQGNFGKPDSFILPPGDSLTLFSFQAGGCVGAYAMCKGRTLSKISGCGASQPKMLQIVSDATLSVFMVFMSAGKAIDTLVYDGVYEIGGAVEGVANTPAAGMLAASPNPLNPSTRLEYTLGRAGAVSLDVFNARGERVAERATGKQTAGRHAVNFDATGLASGMYVCRLSAGKTEQTRPLMLIK